jgi:hypothetical protein
VSSIPSNSFPKLRKKTVFFLNPPALLPGLVRLFKRDLQVRRQWLPFIILANQEAEIRRTAVQSQPRQIVRPYLKKTLHRKKGWWSGSRCRP